MALTNKISAPRKRKDTDLAAQEAVPLNLLNGIDNPAYYSNALKNALAKAKAVEELQQRETRRLMSKGLPKHLCKSINKPKSKFKGNIAHADDTTLSTVYGDHPCGDCRQQLAELLRRRKAATKKSRRLSFDQYPPPAELLQDIPLHSLCCLASWQDLASYFSQAQYPSPEPLMANTRNTTEG